MFEANSDFAPTVVVQVGIFFFRGFGGKDEDVKVTADIKDGTKAVDFGVGIGGTYSLTPNAFVQARYTLGVTNVYDGSKDWKNGNIQVAFGWKF